MQGNGEGSLAKQLLETAQTPGLQPCVKRQLEKAADMIEDLMEHIEMMRLIVGMRNA